MILLGVLISFPLALKPPGCRGESEREGREWIVLKDWSNFIN